MTSKIVVNNIESDSGISSVTFTSDIELGTKNLKGHNLESTGIVTAVSFTGSGANLTNLDASDLASGTVPTARLGSGTASSSTFLAGDSTFKTVSGTTINSNADNRVITGSGTANTLNGESGLTYNGTAFRVDSATSENNAFRVYNTTTSATTFQINGEGNSFQGHTYPRTDSNLDLGYHATNKWRDVVLSGGIRFGSANEADYLDDYEEGSWTGAIVTGTATISDEWYVKIGRLVIGAGRASAISDTSSGNYITISGLPFSVSGGESGYGACAWSKMDASNTSTMSRVNGSTLQFMRSSQSTGSWNYVLHSNMVQSSGGFHFGFNYFVA